METMGIINNYMNTITCKCEVCKKLFKKFIGEYNRKIKKKTPFYCSLECSGKISIDKNNKIKKWNKSKKNTKHLKSICTNRRDEYSDFRYLYRTIKMRAKEGKEFNLTLHDLKDIWEKQTGCCAILNHKITLPIWNVKNNNSNYLASIDRIDSKKGYIKDNIRFVCLTINYAKNKFDDNLLNDFIQLCKNS